MDLIKKLEELRAQEQALTWQGTFADYFDVVKANPHVAQLSHARIFDMITSAEMEEGKGGLPHYNFFDGEIFGLDKALQQVVEYFSSGAQRLEVRKRILLLMGPVGGGKSTIVALLKRGLEAYSRTEQGALYAIADCPMHEEPLHLIPMELREDFMREYGIYIEGDLCPHCRFALENTYEGHIERVPVRRIAISEKKRLGIGTFMPSDPKCVTGDTILLSDQGMLRFDEIQNAMQADEDKFVAMDIGVAGRSGMERTSHFYNGGIKPTRRVRTRMGYEIEGSLRHPVLVMRNGKPTWVRLGDLNVGDYVALKRGTQLFGETTELPAFAYEGPQSRDQNKALRLPTIMTTDLARLLGYIVAEGSLTDTALWLTNAERGVLDDIHLLCESVFGVRPKEYRKAGSKASSVSISSIKLVRWLEQMCGITRGAANKCIPRVIMCAPKAMVLSFLEGLFWGDGTISARKALKSNRFKIATASREMARQVQVILLNLGIVSALYKEIIQRRFTAYSVVVLGDGVLGLVEEIPSLREKCTVGVDGLIAARGNTNFDLIPGLQSTVKLLLDQVPYGQKGSLWRFSRYGSTETSWGRKFTHASLSTLVAEAERVVAPASVSLATLKRHLDRSVLWLDVQEIAEGIEQVYDLTVPGSHSFCANGFINHNSQDISELTGSIDLSTIGEYGSESDPRAYRFDGELNIANRGMMEFVEMLKCLTGDALVFTSKGIRRIDSFASPDHPANSSRDIDILVASESGVESATQLYHAGIKLTKRITTQRGYVTEGAFEHRVMVVNNDGVQVWRRHDEVEIGDWMVMQRGQNIWGSDARIDWEPTRRFGKPILVPEYMTPRLARLLGYLTAEGDTRPDGLVCFSNMDQELRADYCSIVTELFGLRPQPYTKTINVNSVMLLDLLSYLGFHTGAYNKEIPWSVMQSSRECMVEFLRGYFAGDGSVGLHGRLFWATAAERLASQMQTVLLNLGVVSRSFTTLQRTHPGKPYKPHLSVVVDGADADRLASLMNIIPAYKSLTYEQRSVKQRRYERTDILPNTAHYWRQISDELQRVVIAQAQAVGSQAYRTRTGAHQILGEDYTNLHMVRTGTNSCTRPMATKLLSKLEGYVEPPVGLTTLLNPALFYDKVVSIEDAQADCWDFHVPGSNTFIANGFVGHNCDERFLYVLLTLSQEQNIKTGRFSMIYADEVVVSHTNETEYKAFVGNKKSEALQDRIILVKVPYNLRVSDEVRIYEKLLKQSALQSVHIAPHTLEISSIFAVLTRLEGSKKAGITPMKKLKLYDGEDVDGFKQRDLKELQEESDREGMDGISPRYVINRLSSALVREGVTCINPIDALRALRDGLEQHTSVSREQRENYLNLIGEARKEYDEVAKREVQKAFVYSFEESARTLLNNYLDNVEAFCNHIKLRDQMTDEEVEPDEMLMRSIEEQIGIGDTSRKAFREEILIRISSLARRGQQFDYTSHERLREAIEKKLFADLRDVVKITTSVKTPDQEQLRRINDVINRLVEEHGYCTVCANQLLLYVGSLLNR